MQGLSFLDSVKKMPLMALPVRSVLVNLENAVILISPGSCLADEQLKSIGRVTDIVAPNLFHCAGISHASSIFPKAKKWAPIGGKDLKTKIQWDEELAEQKWPYGDELVLINIQGMPKINEAIFIHKKSKSLIIADLCFNMTESKGLGAWIILNLFGTYKKFAVSSFFMKHVEDRELFKKSVEKILSFDFENIIVGHGQSIFGNGRQILLKALNERGVL